MWGGTDLQIRFVSSFNRQNLCNQILIHILIHSGWEHCLSCLNTWCIGASCNSQHFAAFTAVLLSGTADMVIVGGLAAVAMDYNEQNHSNLSTTIAFRRLQLSVFLCIFSYFHNTKIIEQSRDEIFPFVAYTLAPSNIKSSVMITVWHLGHTFTHSSEFTWSSIIQWVDNSVQKMSYVRLCNTSEISNGNEVTKAWRQ